MSGPTHKPALNLADAPADAFSAMTQDLQNAYLRAKVFSASPEELRLMLFDGALRFARQAREGLVAKNYEQSCAGFANSRAIVLELVHSISPETDPQIRSNLSGLYMFIFRRLIDASLEKSPEIVDEAIRFLEYERETWAMYMEKFGPTRPAASADHAATTTPPEAARPALSLQA